jgi:peptide/nickel transport system substrate-binding protein
MIGLRLLLPLSVLAGGSMLVAPAMAEGQSILFLTEDVPASLDYDGTASADPPSQMGLANVMEPLFGYGKGGQNESGVTLPDFSKPEGRLVESWQYDPKSLTWTLHLRHGVKSCAGNTFSAKDVVYTFQRSKSVSGATPVSWFLSNVASVKGFTSAVFGDPSARILKDDEVKAVDDYTVTVAQSEPNSLFLPVMAVFAVQMFDSEEMKARATASDPWSHNYTANVTAPSFGPYCVERWVKGEEIVFKANSNYYRGKPAIDRIVMRRVPQSSNRLVILRTGQAQLVQGLTPREYDSLKNVPGVKVEGVEGSEALFAIMNFDKKPFDNPLIRQAVAAAIPVDRIIKTGYFGEAKPWRGVIPSIYPGYVEPPTQYSYDPAKAKALLAEAGYPGGKGLEKFADSFQLVYTAEREARLGPIVNIIQSSLREVGIPATLNPIPQAQFTDRLESKRDLPFAVTDNDYGVVVDAGFNVQLFFVSHDKGGMGNRTNYSNPMVDATWLKARGESDPAKRNAMVAEIQEQVMKDTVYVPIAEHETQWAMTDKLEGMTWYPENGVRFFDLRLK